MLHAVPRKLHIDDVSVSFTVDKDLSSAAMAFDVQWSMGGHGDRNNSTFCDISLRDVNGQVVGKVRVSLVSKL